MPHAPTLLDLRCHAIARTLIEPTTLRRAIKTLGYVQADPIRAPARARDLTLRHRVRDYRAGDLERQYPALPIEEDFFVNYGFIPRATQAFMHPRKPPRAWTKTQRAKAEEVLAFVRHRGVVHPREVDAALRHGKITNWFGGSSNATTQLLDALHYRGALRVARREGGIRTYALRTSTPPPEDPSVAMDALVDIIVGIYAPLPERSLGALITLLRGAVPHWAHLRRDAFSRAKKRMPYAAIAGVRWYWPEGETPRASRSDFDDEVRLLAPFDPLVWDRRRFELLWGWAYRFEAYTPAARRIRGYYALPMLWKDRVIGWANVSGGRENLRAGFGYIDAAPRGKAFRAALDRELDRMRVFLGPR